MKISGSKNVGEKNTSTSKLRSEFVAKSVGGVQYNEHIHPQEIEACKPQYEIPSCFDGLSLSLSNLETTVNVLVLRLHNGGVMRDEKQGEADNCRSELSTQMAQNLMAQQSRVEELTNILNSVVSRLEI